MGVKSIKEHYKIVHIVHKEDGVIHIGSPLSPSIIVIGTDGVITKRNDSRWSSNADLERYQKEIDADASLFVQLLNQEDQFEQSITVYSWDGNDIVEELTEKVGWPNTTHSGVLQYDNSHYTDKSQAIQHTLSNLNSGIRVYTERVEDLKKEIVTTQDRISKRQASADRLVQMLKEIESYPQSV